MPLRTERQKGRWGHHDPRPWSAGSGAEVLGAEERRWRALEEMPELQERADAAVSRARQAQKNYYTQCVQLARLEDNLPFLHALRGIAEKYVKETAEEAWVGDRVAERYPLDCPFLADEPRALVSLHKTALDRLTAQAQRGHDEASQAADAIRSRRALVAAAHRQAAHFQEIADRATQDLERCKSEYLQNVAPFLRWARYRETTAAPGSCGGGGGGGGGGGRGAGRAPEGLGGTGTTLPAAPEGGGRGPARAAGGGGYSFRRGAAAGTQGGGRVLEPSAGGAAPAGRGGSWR